MIDSCLTQNIHFLVAKTFPRSDDICRLETLGKWLWKNKCISKKFQFFNFFKDFGSSNIWIELKCLRLRAFVLIVWSRFVIFWFQIIFHIAAHINVHLLEKISTVTPSYSAEPWLEEATCLLYICMYILLNIPCANLNGAVPRHTPTSTNMTNNFKSISVGFEASWNSNLVSCFSHEFNQTCRATEHQAPN